MATNLRPVNWPPTICLLAALLMIGLSVHRWVTPEGGLRIANLNRGSGASAIRTGGIEYPRQARDSDNYPVHIARSPRRIASQYWSLDEFLYSVVPAERVVAVSESAFLSNISNVHREVAKFQPAISADPERVLRLSPDLVLVSNGARIDFSDLVRSTGIPIYRAFTMFTTLDQIAETIRATAYLTGEDENGRVEINKFWSVIESAKAMKRKDSVAPRVLGYSGGYSYGDQTLFHDIVQTLGGINVAAAGGLKGYSSINSEQILRWNPEWIITTANPGQADAMRQRLLADPGIALTQAARNGRIIILNQNVFLPMSPYSTLLVVAIAEAIYG